MCRRPVLRSESHIASPGEESAEMDVIGSVVVSGIVVTGAGRCRRGSPSRRTPSTGWPDCILEGVALELGIDTGGAGRVASPLGLVPSGWAEPRRTGDRCPRAGLPVGLPQARVPSFPV